MVYIDVTKILTQEPQLSLYGFLVDGMVCEREKMRDHQTGLEACCQWLDSKEKVQSVDPLSTSYHLSHMVGQDTGIDIPTGIFIMAAIHCGFEYERRGKNTIFNIDHSSLTSDEELRHIGGLVKHAEAITAKSDGHLTLMRFTTGWKAMLATPDLDSGGGRKQIWELEMFPTLADALQDLISRD